MSTNTTQPEGMRRATGDPCIIYARVSTRHQESDRQIKDLTAYIAKRGEQVARVFKEQISGSKKSATDTFFLSMLAYCKANGVRKIYTWELSRIGRDYIEMLETIKRLTKEGICLHIHTQNIESINPDGSVNHMASFLMYIFGALAEQERELLKARLRSGLKHYKDKGGKVGRKAGYKKDLIGAHGDILRLLAQGLSIRQVATLTGKSSGTVMAVKKEREAMPGATGSNSRKRIRGDSGSGG